MYTARATTRWSLVEQDGGVDAPAKSTAANEPSAAASGDGPLDNIAEDAQPSPAIPATMPKEVDASATGGVASTNEQVLSPVTIIPLVR